MSEAAIKTKAPRRRSASRTLPVIVTLGLAAIAAALFYALWQVYMGSLWTRDGTVRAYVVALAPDVTGRVIALPVTDNQFVQKGDLVMKIDPRDALIAVKQAEAAVDQAKADLDNKTALAARRERSADLSASEERQTYVAAARIAQAAYNQEFANLDKARLDLDRSELHAPVNGWVTNLMLQPGDYASAGQAALSLVDADSFWIDASFEEGQLPMIKEGDPAKIWLMGDARMLQGHVESLARAIAGPDAPAGSKGVAAVNPSSGWFRFALRVPVRIHIDNPPKDLRLIAGTRASVEVDPKPEAVPPVQH